MRLVRPARRIDFGVQVFCGLGRRNNAQTRRSLQSAIHQGIKGSKSSCFDLRLLTSFLIYEMGRHFQ